MTDKEYFDKAMNLIRNKKYNEAKKIFECTIESAFYREGSLYNLVDIYLKEGNYKEAREMYNKYYVDNIYCALILARIEENELNHNSSLELCGKCLLKGKHQENTLIRIANNYMSLREFEKAYYLLETITFGNNRYIRAMFLMIELLIIEGNYKEAEQVLNFMDCLKMTKRQVKKYENISKELKFKMQNDFACIGPTVYPSHDLFIKHMSKHYTPREFYDEGYFFKNIDLIKLANEIKERIKNMNSTYHGLSNIYLLKLDKEIGLLNNVATKDLKVITNLDNRIITMYPMLFSDDFDREGFSTDFSLKLKSRRCD